MISSTLQWVVVTALVLPTLGKIYNNPTELTKTNYDYIVVGAGAAGAVVAARLTEDRKISVLLVEAGISNDGIVPLTIPFLGPSLSPGTAFDWNFTTTNQAGLFNRTVPYPRGKILGGSTSINFMAYMHGSVGDFDRYAAVTGDSGWNWNNMQKYIKKNENLVPPADHHNTTGELIPSLHSTSGALSVSLSGSPTPLDARVIATTKELSGEFPFNPDGGGGNVLGIGYNFATIGNGTRCSSVIGYLAPAFGRSNLDIVINAQATKLQVTGKVKGLPSFKSVLVTEKAGAPVRVLTAKNEIILSAGVFGTATLLQLSGIGDRAELQAAGVATVVHNPSVGKNMSDHALLANMWTVNNTNSFDSLVRDPNLFNAALNQWTVNKTGPMTGTVANNIGWFRLPKTASIFKTTPDPAAGPKSSHYEMIFSNLWVDPIIPAPATGNFMSITTALIAPTSRGFIKIMSSNPFAKPLLNPNFMTTDFDIFTMVEAVKAAKRFLAAKAWKGYVLEPAGDLKTANTDEEIAAYVRGHSATVWHAAGTAMMSAKNAKYGVVDPDLKVKGVDGLRVVDGSILPFVPNAHTQGPIYLIAERGADLIKKDCPL